MHCNSQWGVEPKIKALGFKNFEDRAEEYDTSSSNFFETADRAIIISCA